MKYLMLAALTSLLCAPAPAQNHDARLMAPTEYKALLVQINTELPIWEAALKKVDAAKANISYTVGKRIEDSKTLGLREAAWAREWAAKERVKHTVSGELGLEGFLRSLYDSMDSVNSIEAVAGMGASGLEGYAPEISSLLIRISNDVAARVEELERDDCP